MHARAIDLKEFYDSTQGRVAQRMIRRHVRQFWPEVKKLRVMGAGFAVPYLKPMMVEAERVIALMPGSQGAVFWPQDEKGITVLSEDDRWPIETNSIDRLLVIHGFDDSDSVHMMLTEAWRVLSGQGRLLLVVPNRTGLWARFDTTPFGHGTPWSMGQIRQMLKEGMFVPESSRHALFVPPFRSRLMMATAPLWERIGSRFFSAFGGVNMVEATKQVYAGAMAGAVVTSPAAIRRRLVAPQVNREGAGS